jgi:hypothetical protein
MNAKTTVCVAISSLLAFKYLQFFSSLNCYNRISFNHTTQPQYIEREDEKGGDFKDI